MVALAACLEKFKSTLRSRYSCFEISNAVERVGKLEVGVKIVDRIHFYLIH